jgi:hypothetical protein
MTRGFHQRKHWAMQMHERYTSDAMATYYDVGDDAITPIDADADGGNQAGALAIDRDGGVDTIVSTPSGTVFVAERVRPQRYYRGQLINPDFSLRVETATGSDAEYRRLLEGWRLNRDIPSVYVFGIGAEPDKDDCLSAGLQAMLWIDTATMLERIDGDDLPSERHQNRKTGELTEYIDIADLRRTGCIIDEAWNDTLKSLFDDSVTLDDDFPRSNPRIDGNRCRLGDFA